MSASGPQKARRPRPRVPAGRQAGAPVCASQVRAHADAGLETADRSARGLGRVAARACGGPRTRASGGRARASLSTD
eukprot:5341455-Alexandrium_andersonii.AAC.1